MSEPLQGYQDVPEEDRRKAKVFFDRGKTVADTGNFEYAIEMYLQGLQLDPEEIEAHKAIREISLKRKASGGKNLGMFERMKIGRPTKDDKSNMLNAEKLLAYDPGNTDHMQSLLQNAHRAGYFDTVMWIGQIFQKANADSAKPEFSKFIVLKDVYKDLRQWKLATDACHYAARLRPDDMDLQTELKNLGAQHTMDEGRYGSGKSFRDSIRDADKQQQLMEGDKDVRSMDSMTRGIREAEAEFNADPSEAGKLMKLVDALVKTEQTEHELRAMELLDQQYQNNKQFRFRLARGQIRMRQLAREERALRAQVQANAGDAEVIERYKQFTRDRAEEELSEYQQAAEAYPTDSRYKFEVAKRLFQLGRFDEAIPAFQSAGQDPKYRNDSRMAIGQAFLEAGFVDEASETLRALIEEYPLKGDTKSKEMYYHYGRALEQGNDMPSAIKCYSQVAQWDFNYRDVQARIKRLRSGGATPSAK